MVRTSSEPLEAASAGEPVAHESAAHATDYASDGQDAGQRRGVHLWAQVVHPLVEGGLPADQRPAAHVVHGSCKGDGLQRNTTAPARCQGLAKDGEASLMLLL